MPRMSSLADIDKGRFCAYNQEIKFTNLFAKQLFRSRTGVSNILNDSQEYGVKNCQAV